MKPEAKHYHWLDWLRFGAALMVVMFHARVHTWVDWASLPPSDRNHIFAAFLASIRLGPQAVILFFVLSGFLVGGKLLERSINQKFNLWDYALDRFTRIYLPLLPALTLTVIVNQFSGEATSGKYPSEILGNLFNLQGIFCAPLRGDAPLWSLSYEVWFYLLAGALASLTLPALVQSKGRLALALGLIFLGLGIFSVLNAALLFCWALGALAYIMAANLRSAAVAAAGMVLAVAGCAWVVFSAPCGCSGGQTISQSLSFLTVAAGAALVLPWLVRQRPQSQALARLESAGKWPAAFSYTLYLTHFPVLAMISKFQGEPFATVSLGSFGMFFLKVGGCVLVAWLIYLPFERQTSAARKRLRQLFGVAPAKT